jgi:hypothetical protein
MAVSQRPERSPASRLLLAVKKGQEVGDWKRQESVPGKGARC